MAQSDRLRLVDLRAAFRLIGECRELGNDFAAWRTHMLDELRRLTGAQLALYLQMRDLGTDKEAIVAPLESGFLDASHRDLWVHYQKERAHRDDPFHQRYYRTFKGGVHTRRLESVVDDAEWRRSRHYNDYIRACGLDDRITSSFRWTTAAHVTQTIVLHRSAADGNYPLRSARLVHLIHDELRPLVGRVLAISSVAPPAGADLPTQLREVLACLLQGDAEKRVAERLAISHHTVNRHVQRLYRRFDVHNRGELMFRCRDMFPSLLRGVSDSDPRRRGLDVETDTRSTPRCSRTLSGLVPAKRRF